MTGLPADSSLGWVHVTEGNVTAAKRLSSSGMETPDLELFSAWMRACWARDGEAMMRQSNEFAGPGREAQKKVHHIRSSHGKAVHCGQLRCKFAGKTY